MGSCFSNNGEAKDSKSGTMINHKGSFSFLLIKNYV